MGSHDFGGNTVLMVSIMGNHFATNYHSKDSKTMNTVEKAQPLQEEEAHKIDKW